MWQKKQTWVLLFLLTVLMSALVHRVIYMPSQRSSLTTTLTMGAVTLTVRDLSQQTYFYQELVGLEQIASSAGSITLGYSQRPVIRLVESKTLTPAKLGSAGLYHTATVFKSRAALAQALRLILAAKPELYSGSADHLVSEAFYFTDPEGNGVELYFDRDPKTWQWQDGRVKMDSLPLDIQTYITQYGVKPETTEKTMGHVHLKVGDITLAKKFYVQTLGFHITSEMPTALFLSDGTYHHHLGLNVWESWGADMRQPALGLESLEMNLASQSDLSALTKRLKAASVVFTTNNDRVTVSDPWGNTLHFQVRQ